MAYNPRLYTKQDHDVFRCFGDWLFQDILSDAASRAAIGETFCLNHGRAHRCQERRQFKPDDPDDELTRARAQCPIQADEGLSHADAHLLALELIRLLWACGHMAEQRPFHGHLPPQFMGGTCGPIFLWDAFAPMLVFSEESPASAAEDSSWCRLYLKRLGAEAQPGSEVSAMYPRALLETADWTDDRRKELFANDFIFMPPTKYKFFVYFLRRHLRAAFERDFFKPERGHRLLNDFEAFLNTLRIFAHDDGEDADPYYSSSLGNFESVKFLDGTDVLLPWGPAQERILM